MVLWRSGAERYEYRKFPHTISPTHLVHKCRYVLNLVSRVTQPRPGSEVKLSSLARFSDSPKISNPHNSLSARLSQLSCENVVFLCQVAHSIRERLIPWTAEGLAACRLMGNSDVGRCRRCCSRCKAISAVSWQISRDDQYQAWNAARAPPIGCYDASSGRS